MIGESSLRFREAPTRSSFDQTRFDVSSIGLASPLPVLIQVPLVHAEGPRKTRQARRPSPSAAEHLRRHGAPHSRYRPRRRLRKGVRIAGYVVGLASCLTLAACLLSGSSVKTDGEASGGFYNGRYASSIELGGTLAPSERRVRVPQTEIVSPVVFPGYLLPDDGSEESPHAGG